VPFALVAALAELHIHCEGSTPCQSRPEATHFGHLATFGEGHGSTPFSFRTLIANVIHDPGGRRRRSPPAGDPGQLRPRGTDRVLGASPDELLGHRLGSVRVSPLQVGTRAQISLEGAMAASTSLCRGWKHGSAIRSRSGVLDLLLGDATYRFFEGSPVACPGRGYRSRAEGTALGRYRDDALSDAVLALDPCDVGLTGRFVTEDNHYDIAQLVEVL
jgi:hypothetical protein